MPPGILKLSADKIKRKITKRKRSEESESEMTSSQGTLDKEQPLLKKLTTL